MASSRTNPEADFEHQSLGYLLSRVGLALCVIFLAVVLATALPPQLLNPAWKLRVIGALINNGTIGLLGFVLILIAPSFHPASGRLRRQRDRFAHLATAAAIGYLLLIPLQGVALMRGLQGVQQEQTRALRRGTAQIEEIRQAVLQARSSSELQSRLSSLRAPLPPLDVSRPIEVIRPQLLAILKVTQGTLRQRSSGLPGGRLWALSQESLRVGISALAFAAAFAAGAKWPGSSLNLFDAWLQAFKRSRLRLMYRFRTRGNDTRASSQAYLEEIGRSAPDEPTP